jgi:hypothetical protein
MLSQVAHVTAIRLYSELGKPFLLQLHQALFTLAASLGSTLNDVSASISHYGPVIDDFFSLHGSLILYGCVDLLCGLLACYFVYKYWAQFPPVKFCRSCYAYLRALFKTLCSARYVKGAVPPPPDTKFYVSMSNDVMVLRDLEGKEYTVLPSKFTLGRDSLLSLTEATNVAVDTIEFTVVHPSKVLEPTAPRYQAEMNVSGSDSAEPLPYDRFNKHVVGIADSKDKYCASGWLVQKDSRMFFIMNAHAVSATDGENLRLMNRNGVIFKFPVLNWFNMKDPKEVTATDLIVAEVQNFACSVLQKSPVKISQLSGPSGKFTVYGATNGATMRAVGTADRTSSASPPPGCFFHRASTTAGFSGSLLLEGPKIVGMHLGADTILGLNVAISGKSLAAMLRAFGLVPPVQFRASPESAAPDDDEEAFDYDGAFQKELKYFDDDGEDNYEGIDHTKTAKQQWLDDFQDSGATQHLPGGGPLLATSETRGRTLAGKRHGKRGEVDSGEPIVDEPPVPVVAEPSANATPTRRRKARRNRSAAGHPIPMHPVTAAVVDYITHPGKAKPSQAKPRPGVEPQSLREDFSYWREFESNVARVAENTEWWSSDVDSPAPSPVLPSHFDRPKRLLGVNHIDLDNMFKGLELSNDLEKFLVQMQDVPVDIWNASRYHHDLLHYTKCNPEDLTVGEDVGFDIRDKTDRLVFIDCGQPPVRNFGSVLTPEVKTDKVFRPSARTSGGYASIATKAFSTVIEGVSFQEGDYALPPSDAPAAVYRSLQAHAPKIGIGELDRATRGCVCGAFNALCEDTPAMPTAMRVKPLMELFNDSVNGMDGKKSSGWSAHHLPGNKGAWLKQPEILLYFVTLRLAARVVHRKTLPHMAPYEAHSIGLLDPRCIHPKEDGHNVKKQREQRWRCIWVSSIVDLVCQDMVHRLVNKNEKMAYQAGERHFNSAIGVGHHPAGVQRLGASFSTLAGRDERECFKPWLGEPGYHWPLPPKRGPDSNRLSGSRRRAEKRFLFKLGYDDASNWDFTVKRWEMMVEADRRKLTMRAKVESGPIRSLYELLIDLESLANSLHLVSVGDRLLQCQYFCVLASGIFSTSSMNSWIRGFVLRLCGIERSLCAGDDAVYRGILNLERFTLLGHIQKPGSSGYVDVSEEIEFNSLYFKEVDGKWSARRTAASVCKILAQLELNQSATGLPPTNDSLDGVAYALGLDGSLSACFRTLVEECGWGWTSNSLTIYRDYEDVADEI